MYNDMILKSIEKLNIYYEGKEISLHDLEKRFIDTFLNEKENSNIYIIPKDSTYFIALFIIYSGLFQYLDNIYSDGNNLIDEIEPGDILEYSKARCEFIGSEDEKLKLKFSDLLYRLPIEQSYKISFYKGSATTLNKYPKDNNRGAKKTRNIISQILNIDNDVFSKVISKSTLIVAHKDSVFSIIEKLKIKFCGELLNIGEVFPIAYCLSEDNYYYFKGNSSKQEPIIKFTSKVYNAKDIIKKNKKINSVVILQDKINKDDLEDVIYISKKNNIDKIRLFFQPLQIEQYIGEERILENFKIVNINDKFFEDINVHDINMLNKKQYRLVKNYINVKEKYVTIKDSSQDRYRKNILRKCRNLINTFEDNNKIIKFIIDARTLAKRISSMIMPLPEYESFFENKNLKRYTIKSVLKELQSFSKSEFVDSLSNESKELISEIYNECLNLYYRELKINNKWTELETIIRLTKNERTGIIVENKYIRKAFRKYLKTRYSLKDNISVESMNTIKESVFEKVIYTSKLDNNYYWNYRALNSGNNIYILSKSE
ncbi:DrmE family protein, partial [Clostridium butyricum]